MVGEFLSSSSCIGSSMIFSKVAGESGIFSSCNDSSMTGSKVVGDSLMGSSCTGSSTIIGDAMGELGAVGWLTVSLCSCDTLCSNSAEYSGYSLRKYGSIASSTLSRNCLLGSYVCQHIARLNFLGSAYHLRPIFRTSTRGATFRIQFADTRG